MIWSDALKEKSTAWLLNSPDAGVRFLALRDLMHLSADDAELAAARRQAYEKGPIGEVLAAMQPEGYWVKPGSGYLPKYTSTVWAVILLAQSGASIEQDARIATACNYVLDHSLAPQGQFSLSENAVPSGTIDCLQGNLCWSLTALGCRDERLEKAYEWMARSVTGEGVAPLEDKNAPLRYYAGKCGPLFACGANDKLPCAWGAAKVMMAFGCRPPSMRTPLIERAIREGMDFLLDNHPEEAGYPNGYADKPSGNWWKFGFPVFYVTDILQVIEAAASLGYGRDPRLAKALQLVLDGCDEQGRWMLQYDYNTKTYGNYGEKKQPNPWVTLRVLRMLDMLNIRPENN